LNVFEFEVTVGLQNVEISYVERNTEWSGELFLIVEGANAQERRPEVACIGGDCSCRYISGQGGGGFICCARRIKEISD